MDRADIDDRFDYHPPLDADVARAHEMARAHFKELALVVNELVPEGRGREKALAVTALEQALFWTNAGIARGD